MNNCECCALLSKNSDMEEHRQTYKHYKLMGIIEKSKLTYSLDSNDDGYYNYMENNTSDSEKSYNDIDRGRVNQILMEKDFLLEYIENLLNKSSFVSVLKTLSQYNIKDKNQISQTIILLMEKVFKQFEKSCRIGVDFKSNRKKVEVIDKSGNEIEFVDPIKIFGLYLKSNLDGYVAGLYGFKVKFNNENIQKAFEVILKSHIDHSNDKNFSSAFNFGGSNASSGACFECHCPNNQMHNISQTFLLKLDKKQRYTSILLSGTMTPQIRLTLPYLGGYNDTTFRGITVSYI
ncbi:hypothetical protein ACTFIZ_012858 [Dictyostelium cf. discoideum]